MRERERERDWLHMLDCSTSAGMEMPQLICGGCRTLLMYTCGATSVRCSCCHTVNLAPGIIYSQVKSSKEVKSFGIMLWLCRKKKCLCFGTSFLICVIEKGYHVALVFYKLNKQWLFSPSIGHWKEEFAP